MKKAGGLAAVSLLGGCKFWEKPKPPTISRVIDVHSHLFNGSDLPTVRFIKIVMLHQYPKQAVRTLDIRDADVLDGLIALLTWIVGRTRAPTAAAELQVLDGRATALALNGKTNENEGAVIDAVASFAAQDAVATASTDLTPKAFRAVRTAILTAAGEEGLAASAAPLAEPEAKAVAAKAYRSKADIGLYLRWFGLFTRYRYVLAEELSSEHGSQGFEAALICPAAIDYDFWLGESVDRSPMPSQVAVMGRLARRKDGPVVHGYVGFDPLREVYFSAGIFKAYDPMALVRRAVREEGFLGVKLYPPMGFRALGNAEAVCQTYSKNIVGDLSRGARDDPSTAGCSPRPADGSTSVGQRLDAALVALFDFCAAEEAAVLAHAANSNAAADGYGGRADPAYWTGVFKRWPNLRVGLAHFGRFEHRSAAAPAKSEFPDASWEWAFGNYLRQAGDPPLFADISYLTEIFDRPQEQQASYVATFRRWVNDFDPECRHLMFGTDWTMLGLHPAYDGYTKSIHNFFRQTCGFDQPRLDRLFFGNAARFLGLRDGDGARERLLKFYDKHQVPRSRMPSFAT